MAVDYDILRRSATAPEQIAQGMASFRQNQLLQMQQEQEMRAQQQQQQDMLYRQTLGQFLGQNTVNTLLPVADQEQQQQVVAQQQNALMQMNPTATMQALQAQGALRAQQDVAREAARKQQEQQAATIVQHAQAVQASEAPAKYVQIRYPDIYQHVIRDNPDAQQWGNDEWRAEAAKIEQEFVPQTGEDPYKGAFTVGETRYTAAGKPIVKVVDELERKRLELRDAELKARAAKDAADENPNVNDKTAEMIANYQLPPISPFAMSKPAGMALMSRVAELNPAYNGAEFPTRLKAYKDFSTGMQGKAVKSFNVAISHLDTLSQLSDALDTHDIKALNTVQNFFKEQTGSPAPTNFNAAKKIVADELVKAIVGSGGALADREETAKQVSAASSPAQLKGVINTYLELMGGQLGGLQLQYEETTGRKDFDRKLSDQSKAVVSRLHGGSAGSTPGGAPAVGSIEDGHRFKGGDPANPANWEKI